MKTSRELELEHHIRVLRDALQDAPHSAVVDRSCYYPWYQQQRGPALDSTDPNRWKAYKPVTSPGSVSDQAKQRHPIQPVVVDERGVERFKANAIVRYLLDHGGIDLNQIAAMDFSADDRCQFAQLIGHSVSGIRDADDITLEAVERMKAGEGSSDAARADAALAKLAAVRDAIRDGIADLFEIHPNDLKAEE